MASERHEGPPRPYVYRRRRTRVVRVGDVELGGAHPIRIQSMTTTPTTDTRGTVGQIGRLMEAGCEIVRVTVPSRADAENLPHIRQELETRGLRVPLVADVHFTPAAAMLAVEHVDKVRINPGNYADHKKFVQREYTDSEYKSELERIVERFEPLVLRAKQLGVALRIGTNHGSLSDRIMNRYGDTAEGMVESALEFVRIAQAFGHRALVLSMKASNPLVCIEAYRLLARRMDEEGMDYPFHLGVTEAGDGLDGRVKSAVGMGALLEEGLGDTVRVSLTEDPVAEVPVARALVAPYDRRAAEKPVVIDGAAGPTEPGPYVRRESREVAIRRLRYGDRHPPVVEARVDPVAMLEAAGEGWLGSGDAPAELLELEVSNADDLDALERFAALLAERRLAVPLGARVASALGEDAGSLTRVLRLVARVSVLPVPTLGEKAWRASLKQLLAAASKSSLVYLASAGAADVPGFLAETLDLPAVEGPGQVVLAALREAEAQGVPALGGLEPLAGDEAAPAARYLRELLEHERVDAPVVLAADSRVLGGDRLLGPAVVLGTALADGLGDGVRLSGADSYADDLEQAWTLLQATRLRLSRADFISCPSCGRTLFELETTTQRIKARTGHLKGVKIAIMGCIVNGPGEMADADFGYVGWGPGKVSLFKGKDCVVQSIPEGEAVERLVSLIKTEGRWTEPPP